MLTICKVCGKEFNASNHSVKTGRKKYCSLICKRSIPMNPVSKAIMISRMKGKHFSKTTEFKKGFTPWNVNKPCSPTSKAKMSATKIEQGLIGDKSPSWKGGKVRISGYCYIYCPNHHSRKHGSYIAEHRLVMEDHIGRPLRREEKVHHINFNKLDNRIENLILFPNETAHQLHHQHLYREYRKHIIP